jgi:hypothetical protein
MTTAYLVHPDAVPNHVGYLPDFLVESDPRPAREQFNERYKDGGWRPMEGFSYNARTHALSSEGDPDLPLMAFIQFRDEQIMIYQYSIILILQKNGTFEVARMD